VWPAQSPARTIPKKFTFHNPALAGATLENDKLKLVAVAVLLNILHLEIIVPIQK